MKPVKWGIISTANIGVAKVIPGMLKSKDVEIVAISSRKKKTAEEWAGKLGIPKAYGSYEEMLAGPEIEAVYNPLPNHLHVPLTLQAARAGKHADKAGREDWDPKPTSTSSPTAVTWPPPGAPETSHNGPGLEQRVGLTVELSQSATHPHRLRCWGEGSSEGASKWQPQRGLP